MRTFRCPRMALVAMAALATTSAFATAQNPDPRGEWPCFRGPGGNGVAPGATPPTRWSDTENLRWKTKLPGPGSSSPIVSGDRIWVTCYSGYGHYLDDGGDRTKLVHHLVCVARETGEVLWDRTVPGPLDADARRVQISEHGFASPTPTTDGERVYAYFGRAGVVAFDREGEVLWQTDLGEPSPDAPPATNTVERGGKTLSLRWGTAASPLLHDGLVIVNASEQSNSVRALDARTGELVWKHESSNLEGCASSPALCGKRGEEVVVVVLGGEIWALAPKTGEMVWRIETEARGGMSPTPVTDGELVYAFGGSGDSHALRLGPMPDGAAPDARVVWKSENLGIPSPVLHDDKLFLVKTDGNAVCLQSETGEVTFKERLDGRTSSVYASPVLADGKLYVVSRKRGTFVYSADGKFELLARNEFDDDSQFNASPAAVGDRLYLRSDSYLYCIGGGA